MSKEKQPELSANEVLCEKDVHRYYEEEERIIENSNWGLGRRERYVEEAKLGCIEAQYKAGVMYHKGVNDGFGRKRLYINIPRAVVFYNMTIESALKTQNNGAYSAACYGLGRCYYDGVGILKDSIAAFLWIKKAAYFGREAPYFRDLSDFYQQGVGVGINLEEAYIWALLYRANTNEQHNHEHIEDLSLEQQLACEKEVSRRECIKRTRPLTDEDVAVFGTTSTQSKAVQMSDKVAIKAPELTTNLAYKFCNKIRDSFEVELVELELLVSTPKTKGARTDIVQLVVRYNHKDKDTKEIGLYTPEPYKINKAERILMLKLARQFSISERDEREKAIKEIIAQATQVQISHLNAMFKAIFPNCGVSNKCPMLSYKDKTLKIKLKVDSSKLTGI